MFNQIHRKKKREKYKGKNNYYHEFVSVNQCWKNLKFKKKFFSKHDKYIIMKFKQFLLYF